MTAPVSAPPPSRLTLGRLWYLARRAWQRGWRAQWAEHRLAHRIEHWRPSAAWPMASVPVHVLACQHDWQMARWMLASFHVATARRWPVVLHDDGTIPATALDAFRATYPELRVWTRPAADAHLATALANFPRCADYRRRMPHGRKIFDVPALAQAERFLLLDPDLLFFAEPTEILRWVDDAAATSCWFNRDFQEPSPIAPEIAAARLGVRLWPEVNSGLCLLYRPTVTDLASLEGWLGEPELQPADVQWRVEQTLFALAASRAARGGLLPPGYEVSPHPRRRPGAVVRHYVGCVRHHFWGEGVWELAPRLTR